MSSIYIFSGLKYNFKTGEKSKFVESQMVFGCFSNLKRIHTLLKGENVQAYSTIARKLKQRNVIIMEDVNIKTDSKSIKVNQLIIRIVEINKIQQFYRDIDVPNLISGEVFRNDLGLLFSNS